jgi:hypothetical protein
MKRLLLLGVCIVLGSALTARADFLAGTLSNATFSESVTVNYTRTTGILPAGGTTTVDQIDFIIAAISVPGAKIQTLSGSGIYGESSAGKFSSPDGKILLRTAAFPANTSTALGLYGSGEAAPQSFINLDSYMTGGARSPTGGTTIAGIPTTWKGYDFFRGVYASTATDNEDPPGVYNPVFPGVGDVLARIFVTAGKNVNFSGLVSLSGTGHAEFGTLTTIPEPGTLALLATGLMGLLAYAWRKRK